MEGDLPLSEHDPEMFALISEERNRQRSSLELIASENFTSRAVMECLGSCLTNKYSEGLPGKRYYGGNAVIDKIESLCQKRALSAYSLDPEKWGVNVQPYSGSPANFAVYTALLAPHSRVMGLDLPSGGHLTHGFYTYNRRSGTRKSISATSIFFESLPYKVNPDTGLIDFKELEKTAEIFKPAMIICGGSAYPREWDYKEFRRIADKSGAFLMADIAHISGLVATGEAASPFEYCDIVTTTTHKSLRGPRAGMIFCKLDERNLLAKVNFAVFPSLQGGPHEHQIAGIATQLKNVQTESFKTYAKQVRANAKALAQALIKMGYKLCTGGTDNHLILWDLKPQKLTGSKMERLCEIVMISLNKNTVVGDRSALSPGGVRIGTPSLTTRGFKEADFVQVAKYLDLAVKNALRIQALDPANIKLVAFTAAAKADAAVQALKTEIEAFARSFPMPGIHGCKGSEAAPALPSAATSSSV